MYKHFVFFVLAIILFSYKETKANSKESQKNNISNLRAVIPPKATSKNVEIVFCLDATGSMSGLISTAKEKIWDIISDLAQNNDIDTLKMGMVFYRDRGDDFITKQIALTTDLDGVYFDLLEIQAAGGGDTPESLNQALFESINNMSWSTDDKTYRTIFVVGDCPPHMDYQDDTPYTKSCLQAIEKGIIINTIKLGASCRDAIPHFKKMASCSNGEFLQLDQNATDYTISTPYDTKINEVSKNIDNSRLYYGNEIEQQENNVKKAKSIAVYDKSSATANSARAAYKNSASGKKSWMGSKEIIKDYKNGKIQLEDLEESELPPILKGKTIKDRKKYLDKLQTERDANISELKDLSLKRKLYIRQKEKEMSNKDTLSFSKEVIRIMKKQSKK